MVTQLRMALWQQSCAAALPTRSSWIVLSIPYSAASSAACSSDFTTAAMWHFTLVCSAPGVQTTCTLKAAADSNPEGEAGSDGKP